LADLEDIDQPTVDLTHQAFQLRTGEPLTNLADTRPLT
jgi:magnesium chelatase family protein